MTSEQVTNILTHTPLAPPRKSCVQCRKRKIKCDKASPCSGCIKTQVECVYLTGKRTRKPRAQNELLSKLNRLEGVVKQLTGLMKPDDEDHGATFSDVRKASDADSTIPASSSSPEIKDGLQSDTTVLKEFGKLIITEGNNQYIKSTFWAALHAELADVRHQFDDGDDQLDEDDPSTAETSPEPAVPESDLQGFIFGHSSSHVDLLQFHPLPSQIMFYWEKYLENVNPLTKFVHSPTTTDIFRQGKDDLKSLSRSAEAIMFSVYYSTVQSMTSDDIQTNFGVAKAALLQKYKFAVEQALSKADFLRTSELVVVQAFVLYVSVLKDVDSRSLWSLVGMILRLASALGLHRDGTVLGLSPFEAEIRRRIWYHIGSLDLRAANAFGSVPSISLGSFDTKLPLNINDSDLSREITELPKPRDGLSEMTFVLIRYEIGNAERQLSEQYFPDNSLGEAEDAFFDKKEAILQNLSTHLETTYLRHCDQAGPLFNAAADISRLTITNLSITNYCINGSSANLVDTLPQPVKDRLFRNCIESIEYTRAATANLTTQKFAWVFQNHVQWYAMAYILREVGLREPSELVEKGWEVVEGVFRGWGNAGPPQQSNRLLWKPMRKLMINARRKREFNRLARPKQSPGLASETAMPPFDTFLPQNDNIGGFVPGSQPTFALQNNSAWSSSALPELISEFTCQPIVENEFSYDEMAMDQNESLPWLFDDLTSVLPDAGVLNHDHISYDTWSDIVRGLNIDVGPRSAVPQDGTTPSYW